MSRNRPTRRDLLRALGLGAASLTIPGCGKQTMKSTDAKRGGTDRPNVILVMADDQGWGDCGYNGNAVLKTPNLDQMAAEGIRFDRFYAAAPVCSPTRGSCLTGRHPYRYGIFWAGEGRVPPEEITLADALKTAGYATGHFGKWHVGALSKTIKQGYFPGPVNPEEYSPPWENGFDECFSTSSMMPTYNPYYHVGGDFGTEGYRHVQDRPVAKGQRTDGFRWRDYYWTGPGEIVDEWLEGDDSEIVMNRALTFIRKQAKRKTPFLSLIWFHAPHTPIVAGDADRAKYKKQPIEAQHWYGCLRALDRQVGRLRKTLRRMGIADNTIVWYCSDNGPSYIHNYNSAGPFRGKKAELLEGGVRVPAILEWPAKLTKPRVVDTPVCTSDFYPTILNILGIRMPNQPVLDGIDVMPIVAGKTKRRPVPIAFQAPIKRKSSSGAKQGSKQLALHDNRYKIHSVDDGRTYALYDLVADPGETKDLSADKPEIVAKMKAHLDEWVASCEASLAGEDYVGQPEGKE